MVQLLLHFTTFASLDREKSLNNIHTYIHTYVNTYKHDLSRFSIACWTPASRLRRSENFVENMYRYCKGAYCLDFVMH